MGVRLANMLIFQYLCRRYAVCCSNLFVSRNARRVITKKCKLKLHRYETIYIFCRDGNLY